MRIWLDDRRRAPDGFIHVRNLVELQELLVSNSDTIDVMSFDYDLGDGPNGYQVAQWLAQNHPERWPLETRVHSANRSGAAALRAFDQIVRYYSPV